MPPIRRPIAGWKAFLGCLLVFLIGSTIAAGLTPYAPAALGPAQADIASGLLSRQYGPLFELARLWEFAVALAMAAVPIAIGRRRLRLDQYGRFAGRFVVFSADFFLSLAAIAGASDALGAAAFVLLGTNPFQTPIVLTAVATAAALVAAAVLNRIRIGRFLANLYQISMM